MYATIHDVTHESLKKHATLLHYFGLGFIQLKLGETYRMHFYTKALPPIVDEEDVHNHRYGFVSTILSGTFSQDLFAIVPGETHLLEDESCKEGFVADAPPRTCALEKISEHRYAQGSSYALSASAFHRVRAEEAITFLKRGPIERPLAQVARLVGAERVCPFSKKIPEAELWAIVERMIEDARRA